MSNPEPVALGNIEAEQALLGALLLNNEMYEIVSPVIGAADFYDPVHARIWEAIGSKIKAGALASPITMKAHLADDEGLAELGGTDYLARLAGAAISISASPDYAEIIRDLSRRRSAIEAFESAIEDVTKFGDLGEIAGRVQGALVNTFDEGKRSVSISDALTTAAERINAAYQGDNPPGVDLGIPELTKIIGLAQPDDMILLAGRPSMGKSAIAIEIARRCARDGVGVVYWCGEMSPQENAVRMMSAGAQDGGMGVPYSLARQGKIGENQFKALLQAGRDMESYPFRFISTSMTYMDDLANEIRRNVNALRKSCEDVIVVFDYLQLANDQGKSSYEIVSRISRSIKRLGGELQTPMLTLAQLSRAVESRDNKRPQLSDIRDSGTIEQDASNVIFIYRDEYYQRRALPPEDSDLYPSALAALEMSAGKIELIVAKNRSGPAPETAHIGANLATNTITSPEPQTGYATEAFA